MDSWGDRDRRGALKPKHRKRRACHASDYCLEDIAFDLSQRVMRPRLLCGWRLEWCFGAGLSRTGPYANLKVMRDLTLHPMLRRDVAEEYIGRDCDVGGGDS